MKYSELFESGAWAEPYYHGTSQRMPEGISDRTFLFLTTDREDAMLYGHYVYECELLMQNVADLTRRNSKAFMQAAANFKDRETNIVEFMLSHNMWAQNKRLEKDIILYLFDIGYEVIDLRDTNHQEEEIFNIVAVGRNVKVGKCVVGDRY